MKNKKPYFYIIFLLLIYSGRVYAQMPEKDTCRNSQVAKSKNQANWAICLEIDSTKNAENYPVYYLDGVKKPLDSINLDSIYTHGKISGDLKIVSGKRMFYNNIPKYICVLIGSSTYLDVHSFNTNSCMQDPVYIKDGMRVFYNPLSDYDRKIYPY